MLLWRAGLLSGALALYVLAGTSLLAVPVGIWQIRASLGWPDLHAIRKNLELGRWLAGAAVLGCGLCNWDRALMYGDSERSNLHLMSVMVAAK